MSWDGFSRPRPQKVSSSSACLQHSGSNSHQRSAERWKNIIFLTHLIKDPWTPVSINIHHSIVVDIVDNIAVNIVVPQYSPQYSPGFHKDLIQNH